MGETPAVQFDVRPTHLMPHGRPSEVKLVDVEKLARREDSNCLQMSRMHHCRLHVAGTFNNDRCLQHFPDWQTERKIFDKARQKPGPAHGMLFVAQFDESARSICRCGQISFKPLHVPEWADL